jgi:hypothetical protein
MHERYQHGDPLQVWCPGMILTMYSIEIKDVIVELPPIPRSGQLPQQSQAQRVEMARCLSLRCQHEIGVINSPSQAPSFVDSRTLRVLIWNRIAMRI